MTLGMEVGFGAGDIALDGDPAPPKRGTAPNYKLQLHLHVTSLAPNRWGQVLPLLRKWAQPPQF